MQSRTSGASGSDAMTAETIDTATFGQEWAVFGGKTPGGFMILFTDATSGFTTYPANRALRVAAPAADGTVTLDFNRAVNVPCAYTAFATCPLPPAENRLPIAVEAGEKTPPAAGPASPGTGPASPGTGPASPGTGPASPGTGPAPPQRSLRQRGPWCRCAGVTIRDRPWAVRILDYLYRNT